MSKNAQQTRQHTPETAPTRLPWIPFWLVALIGGAAAIVPYWLTVQHGFVWDDSLLLVDWPYYRDRELFVQALWRYLPFSPNYFRPVAAVSFFADYALHGLEPAGYHIANVLIYGLITVAFAWLTYDLMRRLAKLARPEALDTAIALPVASWAALLLTLAFAWHPVHAEAVAFISSRFDLLSTLFLLVALALAMVSGRLDETAGMRRALVAAGTGTALLLALGAKEMALTFPLLLFAVDQAWQGPSSLREAFRRQRASWVAVILAILIYGVARFAGLGYLFTPSADAIPAGNPVQHLLLVAVSALRYVLLLIWPFGTLSPIQYGAVPVSAGDPLAWLALATVVGLLAILAWGLRRRYRAAWLWLAFASSLLPVVNLMPLELRGGAIVAERFLLLPSSLFLLALGASLWPLALRAARWATTPGLSWRTVALVLLAVPLVAYLAGTLAVLPHWRNDEQLWRWARDQAPLSTLPPTNLSLVALDREQPSAALRWAQLAVELDPTNSTALNNAGSALTRLGRPDEAVPFFQQAAELRPDNVLYWANLASALAQMGRYGEAIDTIQGKVLPFDPTSGAAYQQLGRLYLQRSEPDLALEALRTAAAHLEDPSAVQAEILVALATSGQGAELLRVADQGQPLPPSQWVDLAGKLRLAGDLEHAAAAYERALTSESTAAVPLSAEDRMALRMEQASVYLESGDLANADRLAIGLVASHPDDARGQKLLGDVLLARAMPGAALEAYKRAAAIFPDSPAIILSMGQANAALGNGQEAEAKFARVAELAPGFAAVHVDWGELLWQQGDVEAARAHFQQYLQMAPEGQFVNRVQAYLDQEQE